MIKTYIQINTKMVNWTQNQASVMAISVPWPKHVGWTEEESAQERTLGDLERFCKEELPQILSLFFTTLLDVTGEDYPTNYFLMKNV